MIISKEFENLINSIPVIKADRNYWFVRTEGGEYYEDFINGKYIAIGYDEIQYSDVIIGKKNDWSSTFQFTQRVRELLPKEKRPGYVAGQLIRFTYLIKKGDIVIIPNKNSNILHFGEVAESFAYSKDNNDDCPHEKRKRVKWIKHESRVKLEAELYKLVFTHTTISNANEYANYVDRLLNNVFIKGEETHLFLDVQQPNKIDQSDFYGFGNIFDLVKEICDEENINIDERFTVKSNVQSPGFIEIIQASAIPLGIIFAGLVIMALTGGKITTKFKVTKEKGLDIEMGANVPVGLIERIGNNLRKKRELKMKADIVKKALENMQIENPSDLVKLIEDSNKNN